MFQEKYYKRFLEKNRYPRQLVSYEPLGIELKSNGNCLINFSSSDYLGLSKHPLLIQRSQDYSRQYGVGSGSSRLVAGNSMLVEELEIQLAQALKKPATLILGTGYQANFTVLESLLDNKIIKQKPIVFSDTLCHVSIYSAARQFSETKRFHHNDLDHLEELLESEKENARPQFIVAESLYSMEGDRTNLKKLSTLAKRYQAFLYIDDAHSVGTEGPMGWGNAVSQADDIDVVMGTFSKALGSFGGYIACSHTIKEYLVNKCKGLIYSTALPVPILGAISAAIELVPQMTEERKRIAHHVKKLLRFFKENHLNCGTAESHIIPWIIKDSKKTLYASELLKAEGILGVTIRPPSVGMGQSRIRFCISADHQDDHIEKLMKAILKVAGELK